MAFTEAANDGAMNGTTPVTLVASPGVSTRRIVKSMVIYNRDTAAVDITLRYVSGANTRVIGVYNVASGGSLIWETVLILDATNKSITALLGGAAATTNPDFVTTYADAT